MNTIAIIWLSLFVTFTLGSILLWWYGDVHTKFPPTESTKTIVVASWTFSALSAILAAIHLVLFLNNFR